jgi:hypothetical protein
MQNFDSMASFGRHLIKNAARSKECYAPALDQIGKIVTYVAKSKLGKYQPAIGPFAGWAALTEYTINERIEAGFTPNDPLLRSGHLRDSISYVAQYPKLVVGSPLPYAVDQELGVEADRLPPRPFLGPAMFQTKADTMKVLGLAMVRQITYPDERYVKEQGVMLHLEGK